MGNGCCQQNEDVVVRPFPQVVDRGVRLFTDLHAKEWENLWGQTAGNAPGSTGAGR